MLQLNIDSITGDDNDNGQFKPVDVPTTISMPQLYVLPVLPANRFPDFRGQQASYTFPVG
jgi:hypothetical protein